jgi:hypothetical protein
MKRGEPSIRRHLRDEPITARPPTTLYQLRKFARRNRTLVSSSLLLFAVLTGPLIATTSLFLEAQEANKREQERTREANQARTDLSAALTLAQEETAKTTAINEFFIDDFIRAVAPERDGPDVRMMDLITRAAERVPVRFKDQPLIQAEVHLSLSPTPLECWTCVPRGFFIPAGALNCSRHMLLRTPQGREPRSGSS